MSLKNTQQTNEQMINKRTKQNIQKQTKLHFRPQINMLSKLNFDKSDVQSGI